MSNILSLIIIEICKFTFSFDLTKNLFQKKKIAIFFFIPFDTVNAEDVNHLFPAEWKSNDDEEEKKFRKTFKMSKQVAHYDSF